MQSVFAHGAAAAHGDHARMDKLAGIAIALLLHVAALGALLSHEPSRTAIAKAVPLMVNLIAPPAPAVTTPPKPLPMKPARTPPPTMLAPPPAVLAAAPDAQASETVALPPPTPVAPAPAAETLPPAVAAPAAAAAPPAPPAPKAVVAPNFNAAYLNNPPPPYPRLARRQGHHGTVVLRVFVSAGGSAQTVQLRTGCGYDELDQAALDAVRRWRFVPARQGEQPLAAWVLVPITFTLEN